MKISGYQLYYRRLCRIAEQTSGNENRISLEFKAFGGVSNIEIAISAPSMASQKNADYIEVCRLHSNWPIGSELRINSDSWRGFLDLKLVRVTPDNIGARLRRLDGQTILEVRSSTIGESTAISFTLESSNLLVPLPERSPLNRAVAGITVTWREKRATNRVEIVRKPGATTCFTKGNYLLAFPSRPYADSLKTIILYPPGGRTRLLYGFIQDPSTILLRASSMLSLSGLSFFAAWLFVETIIRGPANSTPYIALLATLTIPTVSAFGELAISDRHALYSRHRDIGFALMMLAVLAGAIGIFASLYVAAASGFGSVAAPLIVTYLPLPLIVIGAALLSFGGGLLIFYRSGFAVPYICDANQCTQRIRLRSRRRDCYSTGRIMCRKCEAALCSGCLGNYWIRGLASIDTSPDVAESEFGCLQ